MVFLCAVYRLFTLYLSGMKITFFSSQPYDRSFFEKFNDSTGFELQFLDVALNEQTAIMAKNATAVCVFVNDQVTTAVIQQLAGAMPRLLGRRTGCMEACW